MSKLEVHDSWRAILGGEFEQAYFRELSKFLHQEYANKVIYPPREQVFSAFACDISKVRVVIIGQDPYHGPGPFHHRFEISSKKSTTTSARPFQIPATLRAGLSKAFCF